MKIQESIRLDTRRVPKIVLDGFSTRMYFHGSYRSPVYLYELLGRQQDLTVTVCAARFGG
jgi:hypothetical protein